MCIVWRYGTDACGERPIENGNGWIETNCKRSSRGTRKKSAHDAGALDRLACSLGPAVGTHVERRCALLAVSRNGRAVQANDLQFAKRGTSHVACETVLSCDSHLQFLDCLSTHENNHSSGGVVLEVATD